jgi:hypothetical protein
VLYGTDEESYGLLVGNCRLPASKDGLAVQVLPGLAIKGGQAVADCILTAAVLYLISPMENADA